MIYTFENLERFGRLGNQLHQVAATLGIARSRRGEPRFPTRWSYRPYFSIPDEFFSDEPGTEAWRFATRLDPRVRTYLQDVSLWAHVADDVRRWFAPSPRARQKLREEPAWNQPEEAVAVHVRRGDNVHQLEYFWLPTLDYFRGALARFPRDLPVVVFSDDPEWCASVLMPSLNGRPTTLVRGVPRKKEHEPGYWDEPTLDWVDLFAQARIKHHVISNSTFSWWAAWLSGDPAPICPRKWYGPKLGFVRADLMFPQRWGWPRI